MNKEKRKGYLGILFVVLVFITGIVYYYFLSSFSRLNTSHYVYIDKDDNIDSVNHKLEAIASPHTLHSFKLLTKCTSYSTRIREGRYEITPNMMTITVFRKLKNGLQTSVNLTIPSVRTLDKLTEELSKHLMVDKTSLLNSLQDETLLAKYRYDSTTVIGLFIPNTYDIYWTISPEGLIKRMNKESEAFWNKDRLNKAKQLNLTQNQVLTLASIVDEETANNAEKPMIAGMYYKRLTIHTAEYPKGMPLQADPTIKFAWKRFELKRIYNNLLQINSPYNTYKNVGLPPGPIRIPSVAGIDAVLNMVHHDYIYMCAKEDFSGTHNFASTYEEHLKNAAKYTAALNKRGIK